MEDSYIFILILLIYLICYYYIKNDNLIYLIFLCLFTITLTLNIIWSQLFILLFLILNFIFLLKSKLGLIICALSTSFLIFSNIYPQYQNYSLSIILLGFTLYFINSIIYEENIFNYKNQNQSDNNIKIIKISNEDNSSKSSSKTSSSKTSSNISSHNSRSRSIYKKSKLSAGRIQFHSISPEKTPHLTSVDDKGD